MFQRRDMLYPLIKMDTYNVPVYVPPVPMDQQAFEDSVEAVFDFLFNDETMPDCVPGFGPPEPLPCQSTFRVPTARPVVTTGWGTITTSTGRDKEPLKPQRHELAAAGQEHTTAITTGALSFASDALASGCNGQLVRTRCLLTRHVSFRHAGIHLDQKARAALSRRAGNALAMHMCPHARFHTPCVMSFSCPVLHLAHAAGWVRHAS